MSGSGCSRRPIRTRQLEVLTEAAYTHAGKGNDYHLSHGTRLKDGGYSYKGKDHNHWTHRYWFGKYGC